MKTFRMTFQALTPILLTFVIAAQAATFKGTVTNKTTNRPSAGDTVTLVDVQAGMSEAASATTDSSGQYTLDAPGMGPYLVRALHQGGTYFIAAPQGGAQGNVNVYDVAAKVDGVGVDADMLLIEAANGELRVHERFMVRNTSQPPRAQFSGNTFEVALPADAELESASATRPGGLGTNTHLVPLSQKGHYSFNVPIQPNQAEKETLFELQYHLSYNGKYTFTPRIQMPADHYVVYLAKGINFKPSQGPGFQATQDDPRVQTFVAMNVRPGQPLSFSISGEGEMPRDAQSPGMAAQGGMGDGSDSSANGIGNKPGGGIGAPIDSPDPLTKYKWWILSILALALIVAAVVMLRKRGEGIAAGSSLDHDEQIVTKPASVISKPSSRSSASTTTRSSMPTSTLATAPTNSNASLLNLIKDEMFAIEREKISGTLPAKEYAAIKAGLEALLKRTLAGSK